MSGCCSLRTCARSRPFINPGIEMSVTTTEMSSFRSRRARPSSALPASRIVKPSSSKTCTANSHANGSSSITSATDACEQCVMRHLSRRKFLIYLQPVRLGCCDVNPLWASEIQVRGRSPIGTDTALDTQLAKRPLQARNILRQLRACRRWRTSQSLRAALEAFRAGRHKAPDEADTAHFRARQGFAATAAC